MFYRHDHLTVFYQLIYHLPEIIIDTRFYTEAQVKRNEVEIILYDGACMIAEGILLVQYFYVQEPVDVCPFGRQCSGRYQGP